MNLTTFKCRDCGKEFQLSKSRSKWTNFCHCPVCYGIAKDENAIGLCIGGDIDRSNRKEINLDCEPVESRRQKEFKILENGGAFKSKVLRRTMGMKNEGQMKNWWHKNVVTAPPKE